MHTSGLILDVYDDTDGATVRAAFPDGRFPESVKVAHALTHEDREAIPDDLFALVLTDGDDVVLRKYACADQGNTELSVLYFLDHGHKLAAHVQEQTAKNLVTACGWYGIEVPQALEKVALGLGTVMTALSAPSVVKGVHGEAKRNLSAVRAGESLSGVAGGLGAMAEKHKVAEVIGTDIMPTSCDTSAKVKKSDIPLKKSARMESVEVGPSVKSAGRTSAVSALNGRYPLDSYSDVKTASEYFEKHARKLPAMDRREFAVSLVKRASELNIACGELALAYSGEKRASDDTWATALQSRQEHVRSDSKLSALLEKVAEQREVVDPDVFAQLLSGFDKIAGLHYHYDVSVMDPALSAYGPGFADKVADGDDGYLDTSTGRGITGEDIKRFASAHRDYAASMFGEEVAEKLQKDPVGTYSGMVHSRRQVLANMIAEFAGSGRA